MTLQIEDESKWLHVHMIGIAGAGMSAIAQVLAARGYHVTGSDLEPSNALTKLNRAGVHVFRGHDSANVNDADIVVVSTA
ncbi:MAG TPA: UDP-N-acetylmuramate--L-alanine ligase, partial [Armatimonadetes bacterium]|nr:UDP-N-acetylmuramate--L-alanine ligase [Armatimonadota bacterium]